MTISIKKSCNESPSRDDYGEGLCRSCGHYFKKTGGNQVRCRDCRVADEKKSRNSITFLGPAPWATEEQREEGRLFAGLRLKWSEVSPILDYYNGLVYRNRGHMYGVKDGVALYIGERKNQ